MRITPALVAVAFLVLLLTWLLMRAIDPAAERFDAALVELDKFESLEADLHRDVLSARAGILGNYDPLVLETQALGVSVGRLQQIATISAAATSAVEGLAMAVARQESLVEQFKSSNALLQNSLAYFALFSSDRSGAVPLPVASLAASILRLTLDTSAAGAREVQDRLDELARQPSLSGGDSSTEPLLAHGRLLHDLLPATDKVLRVILATPRMRDQGALRATILGEQNASRETARQFRGILYATSLVLVGLLAFVGLRLQAAIRASRRRATFEHVLAGISMKFVTARADDPAVIEHALADMAHCVSAERCYFLLSSPSPQSYAWCSQEATFAPGWPDQALALVERYDPTTDGIVHVPRVTRLPPGTDRDALTAAGIQGWACVSRTGADGGRVLLGLDSVTHSCRISPTGELGLLRVALDTVANALSRQAFEQERARLELRLHQARRLETVGTLASGIAHNFNNIVGAILGYTEMADERHPASGILGEIRRAGERARELIDQIFVFARRHDVRRSPVNMQALAAETVSLLQVSLPAAVEFVVREMPEELTVSGVHTQLQQVILNLCNNAAQAMGNIGRIELRIEAINGTTTRTVSHGVLASGHHVRIAVIDSGRGIDEATLSQIFEPFFTTRMTGSGLGLATTREIVREHGGAINVQSTVGVGSRFEVWLPRIAPVAPATDGDNATFLLGNGETILVVEDDPERLLRDEEVFAALGYEPVGFTDAADARTVCLELPERFDAVVIGRVAPMAAALDLAVALQEAAPRLPILLATTSAEDFVANTLVVAGISDVVRWPIVAAEIAAALQNCLRFKDTLEKPGAERLLHRIETRH